MTEPSHRRRSVAEIVDASIQLFRRSYGELVTIMAIAYVPWLAATTIASRARAISLPADGEMPEFSLAGGLIFLFGFIWLTVASAACTVVASDRYLGRQPEIADSLRRAFRRGWPILATTVFTWVLAGAGLILLIVPGLYFFARFALSPAVALLEDRAVGQSLSRASALSRGRKMHILGALGAAWLIMLAITFTIGALFGLLGLTSLSILADAAVGIGIGPLIPVVVAVLYYDLRIRNEGYDVELLAQELRSSSEQA